MQEPSTSIDIDTLIPTIKTFLLIPKNLSFLFLGERDIYTDPYIYYIYEQLDTGH